MIEDFPFDTDLLWNNVSNRQEKERIAQLLVSRANNGEVIGFGSGTTSMVCAIAFGQALKEGLDISAVVTSYELEWLCIKLSIPVLSVNDVQVDWCFDGADEVDKNGNLLKGRGGAMHRERQVFVKANTRYIVADSSKDVSILGKGFPAPIEVKPHSVLDVMTELKSLDFQSFSIRTGDGKDGPIITESGNIIIDVTSSSGFNRELADSIHGIDGVIDSGLFMGYEYERLS